MEAYVYLLDGAKVLVPSEDHCHDVVVAGWCSELMEPRSKAYTLVEPVISSVARDMRPFLPLNSVSHLASAVH